MDLKRGSSPGCEDCFRRCWRKMLEGFICWRMQFVQTHGARCVAVDIDRLDAVSEKTLQSIFDRSMVAGKNVVRERCEVVAFERREVKLLLLLLLPSVWGKQGSLTMTIRSVEDNTIA